MIKIFSIFFSLTSVIYGHDHIPHDEKASSNFGLIRSIIKIDSDTSVLAEYSSGKLYNMHRSSTLKFGGYEKFGERGKFGAFFYQKTGQRHSDDWELKENGSWGWRDTSARLEQEVHFDYTTSFQGNSLIPLVFTFKPELSYNLFNDHLMFIFTPTMNYFVLERGVPRFSFHTRTPVYTPLNFEGETLYKYGIYQSFLFHFSKRYIFGLTYKYFYEGWSDSKDFQKTTPQEKYTAWDISQMIVFEFIVKI